MSVAWYLDLETGEVTESRREAVELYAQGHEIDLLNSEMEYITCWDADGDDFDFDI